jgi:hypothetical protein
MRVYTLQENDYSDLEETLECIMHKAKKFLAKMEEGEFGSRNYGSRGYMEDDYDWKLKRGSRY